MATTGYGVNSPEAVKLWRRKLFREVLKATSYNLFTGSDSDSLVQIVDETNKSEGDRVTTTLRMQLTGAGVTGDAGLQGNEEALTTYTDNIFIDQLRWAVRSAGRMSEQRIPFSVRDEARMGLQDWYVNRYDTNFFNQLCGNTDAVTGTTILSGNNATSAPDAAHFVHPSTITLDENLTNSHPFDITLLDLCIEKAQTLTPAIRPLNYKGEQCYVAFLHPGQVTQLRTSAVGGQWLDITKSLYTSRGPDDPITKGFVGVGQVIGKYNNVWIISNSRVTRTCRSDTGNVFTTGRRAVFCGAQAALMAFGQENSEDKMTWVEELFDYGNQLGVAVGSIYGMKAARYNSADFGKIVIGTYCVP